MINRVCESIIRGNSKPGYEWILKAYVQVKSFLMGCFDTRIWIKVPTFNRPFDVSEHLRYFPIDLLPHKTPDYADFSTSPEELSAAMAGANTRLMGLGFEDAAVWAYKALQSIPGCTPSLRTLFAVHGPSWTVCTYTWACKDQYSYGAIDVNGLIELPNLLEETIEQAFSFRRSTLFMASIKTPMPW